MPGRDAAGVVVEVGDGNSKFKIGDEVYSNIHDFNTQKLRATRPSKMGDIRPIRLSGGIPGGTEAH